MKHFIEEAEGWIFGIGSMIVLMMLVQLVLQKGDSIMGFIITLIIMFFGTIWAIISSWVFWMILIFIILVLILLVLLKR